MLRARSALSQRALAERAGTSQSAAARLEPGGAQPSSDTLQRLLAAAGFTLRFELSPAPVADPLVDAFKRDVDRTLHAGLNFTLTTGVGDLDLLAEIPGGRTYEDLLPHAITVTVFGRETRILGLDWLIYVKRAAGRPKDLEMIAELEALREETRRSRVEEG